MNLILEFSENCVLTSKVKRDALSAGGNPAVAAIDNLANATFETKDTKLYVPVVTLSTENDKILLEHLRIGFKNYWME